MHRGLCFIVMLYFGSRKVSHEAFANVILQVGMFIVEYSRMRYDVYCLAYVLVLLELQKIINVASSCVCHMLYLQMSRCQSFPSGVIEVDQFCIKHSKDFHLGYHIWRNTKRLTTNNIKYRGPLLWDLPDALKYLKLLTSFTYKLKQHYIII